MCLPLDDAAMVCWLKRQVSVLEAWREELASRPDVDLNQIQQVETHYQWLTSEIRHIEPRMTRTDPASARIINLRA
ncbi:MAG: hypothetical protein AAFR41_01360 [Pseudomonadota bacterium]